ncbi:MAG: hypothetical protein GWP12_02875 [Nitrospirae bacterium]|nr:hypothetical protein [Nitrospirota bacterium]
MKTLTSGNAPSLSMPGGRQRRSIASLLLTVLSIAVLLALHVELLTTTINKSLCCFDDSSFAVVSKNLASGDGYLLTLDYGNVDHSGRLFHPALGTGPSAILVGAAAIKVFGAKPWAPGLMLVLFNALVLSFCIAVISRRLGIARASSYICLVALASIAVTTQHHEQWFAFFGEVQSLALVLASFVLIAYGNRSRLNLLGAGLLLVPDQGAVRTVHSAGSLAGIGHVPPRPRAPLARPPGRVACAAVAGCCRHPAADRAV